MVRILALLVLVACAAPALAQRGMTKERYASAMVHALEAVEARSTPRGPVELHANLFFAHEALIERMPLEVLLKAVDAFAEAGVRQVDINMGLYPWRDHDAAAIAKYDAVVERIRARGMRLGINPQYSPVKHRVSSLGAWRKAALPVYAELAERYKPEVFVVLHEPTTMAQRMGTKARAQRWADFAREAARRVKEKSPESRIGAGGLASEREYFEALLESPAIEVMTFDIYRLADLATYNQMAADARRKGKPVYIEETWRPPWFTPSGDVTADGAAAKSVGDAAFEDIDIRWAETLFRYAGALGLEAVTPFWPQPWFKYARDAGDALDPAYNRAAIEALQQGERTRLFEALKRISAQAR